MSTPAVRVISGLAGAVFAVVLWVVVPLVISIITTMHLFSAVDGGGGSSGGFMLFAVPTVASTAVVALAGFAIGILLPFRRRPANGRQSDIQK